MPLCRLCHQDRELRHSHIVPEFLYEELYNDKGHLMGIHGKGKKGWKPLQKGIREHLFCESCEQHFNEYCEKPFRAQWVVQNPIPKPWNVSEPHWVKVEYSTFKLFHLSVLFRASVTSLPTFAAVSLGPHEERLRQLILAKDPGEPWQYPVAGLVVLHHKTRMPFPMVSQAVRGRLLGMRCYAIIYGGAQWWIGVASQRCTEFESMALRADGSLPLASVPWNELAIMRSASQMLRDAET